MKTRTLDCAWGAHARAERLEENQDSTAIASALTTALEHVAVCCRAFVAKPRQAAQVIASSVVESTNRLSKPLGVGRAISGSFAADQSAHNHLAREMNVTRSAVCSDS